MMKLIDFDEKFNRAMARLIERQAGTRTEEEWENEIAAQYARFGDTPMQELGGETPRRYFAAMGDEALCETLKEYILQGVAVPDLLCTEIESRPISAPILSLLEQTDEQLVLYALNLIGDNASAFPRYAQMLSEDSYDECVKDAVTDLLKEHADAVKEQMLALAEGENAPYALEVLSRTAVGDERVFSVLLNAFRGAAEEDLPLCAAHLAAYGDERALPDLMRAADSEETGFVAFQEIKFAIESLGGSYEKDRDFSNDPAYSAYKAAGAGTDIFGVKRS